FGPDITLWSPPHLLGLLGAQVNTLACLLIAREAWPVGSWARAFALALATTFLFGTFAIATDPSWRIAFLHGGLSFFTWPVLAADDGTSPIAVAHEMARRNGTPVGGSALPRVFPVVGAALLALVDARRRPRAASLAFGAGLLIVMLPRMLGSRALAHVHPDAATMAVGIALTL